MSPSVRAVPRFVLTSFLGMVVAATAALYVQHRVAEREAIHQAQEAARIVARGTVAPYLTERALAGLRPDAARLDAVVRRRVLDRDVVRVKVWEPSGRVAYSDEARARGMTFPLGPDRREAFRSGRPKGEVSALSAPENRFERRFGSLVEFYVPVRAGDGRPVLVEIYQRLDAATESTTARWLAFAPAVLGALALLWALQVPLASGIARRLRADGAAREALLVRAAESSRQERRRIAAAMEADVTAPLAAIAGELGAGPPADGGREVLGRAVAGLFTTVGRLRSLVREIHRPAGAGRDLAADLEALAGELRSAGIRTAVTVDAGAGGRSRVDVEDLLLAAAREAVDNVARHSGARSAAILLAREGDRAVLVVEDDGRGMAPEDRAGAVAHGRLGLSLLEDLARDVGGRLDVGARPEGGTRVRLEAPWT